MENNVEFLSEGNSILAWKDLITLEDQYQKVYKTNVLSSDFCNEIIQESEKVAKKNLTDSQIDNGDLNSEGWYSRSNPLDNPLYKVNIIPIEKLGNDILHKIQILIQQVFIQCGQIYNIDTSRFSLIKGEILKYSCQIKDSSIKLREHEDTSRVTFNISLNSPNEFIDGGLKLSSPFNEGSNVFKLKKGEMLCHAGKQKHEVLEMSEGIRYVLILFVHIKKTVDLDKIEQMEKNCCIQ
jgi:hypothetical protein